MSVFVLLSVMSQRTEAVQCGCLCIADIIASLETALPSSAFMLLVG